MCKGNATTSTTSAPNPAAMGAYTNLLTQAQNVASTPYTPYTQPLVAPINAQQNLGIGNINTNANFAAPYINSAGGLAMQASNPITQATINSYASPYTQAVVNATAAQFANQNAQQMQGVRGNAIAQGAFGGNREAIAEAETANQQNLAQAPVIAGLENQGYQTALQTALAEQQAQQAGAYSLSNIGVAGENAALTGANAQIGAGTLEQQTQQALYSAAYQQFLNQLAYPFQTTQWLAGIDTGVGSQMGGTSTTTAPPPNSAAQWTGLGIAGIGALGQAGGSAGIMGLAPLFAGLASGGVANRPSTIPETDDTLHAQQQQLIAGHRRAQFFPHGSRELSLPDGMKRTEVEHGVFHHDPKHFSAEHVRHMSSGGRENELLDLGPYPKHHVLERIRGGEIPLAIVERNHHGTEVRAALGTHATGFHQFSAMHKTKSPGHTISIEHPDHVVARRLMGGRTRRDLGGNVNYQTFGGGYGTPVMPYSGGHSWVPGMGITHGSGAPRPPMPHQDDTNNQLGKDAAALGQMAKNLSNKQTTNQPLGILPATAQAGPSPVGTNQPVGIAPEVFSPLDPSDVVSDTAIYRRGGVVPGYDDGGNAPDAPMDITTSGVAAPPSTQQMIINAARDQGIDPNWALSVAHQESGGRQFDTNGKPIVSGAGAIGTMQLMPGTAKDLGVDPYDTQQNIQGGVRYLKQLYDKYGDQSLASAAYNAGPGRVDRSLRTGEPLPRETQNYVPAVTGGVHALAFNGEPANGEYPPLFNALNYAPSGRGAAPPRGVLAVPEHDYTPGVAHPPADSAPSDLWPSLMAAGFGMMASRSPYFGVAVGQGGLTGMQTYAGLKGQEQAARLKQTEIDMEAKKLQQQADQEHAKLKEETRWHSLQEQMKEMEPKTVIGPDKLPHTIRKNPDGSYSDIFTGAVMLDPHGKPVEPKETPPTAPPTAPAWPSPSTPTSALPYPNVGVLTPPPPITTAQVPSTIPMASGGAPTGDDTGGGGALPPWVANNAPTDQIPSQFVDQSAVSAPAPSGGDSEAALPAHSSPTAATEADLPPELAAALPQRNEEYFKTLPEDDKPLVKGLVDYQIDPTKSISMRIPKYSTESARERLIREAVLYDKGYEQGLYPAKQKAIGDFLAGTSPQSSATVLLNGNTAMKHASELYDLVDQIKSLPPDQQTWFTKMMTGIRSGAMQAGIPFAPYLAEQIKNAGMVGTPAGEALSRWATMTQRYSDEMGKFYKGGVGSEGERTTSMANLDTSKSAEELKGSLAEDLVGLRAKVAVYNNRIKAAMGPAAWNNAIRQNPDIATTYQSAREDLDRIGMAEARRAIQEGRPREMVIERLKRLGIKTEGL